MAHGVVGSLPRVIGPTDAVTTGIKVPKGVSNSICMFNYLSKHPSFE
jgi:hypothetical protein